MIRNILFDLDDTLLDFCAAEREALRKTLLHFGVPATEQQLTQYHEINVAHWKMLERGEIARETLKTRRYEVFLAEAGIECSAEAVAALYEVQLGQEYATLPGARGLLDTLKKTYRLYAVTNGGTVNQRSRLKGSGLDVYFEDVFISQQVGFDKPSPEYFTYCFRKIPDFRKEETVIVGDSLSSDISGGKNIGIRTIWYAPSGAESDLPDKVLRSLEELPALLECWAD